MKQARELRLFDEVQVPRVKARRPGGGSRNPIVFHDYESYVAKFMNKEKTTDDTYTPKDVYEAVLQYVGEVYDLTGKEILRPFYPGGDYENAEYPKDGVVIDNPPFSMFTKICKFYSERGIPFFLFGPGLTIASCCKYCTAVIAAAQIVFDNGAKVICNFASNIFGDTLVMTAPRLAELIEACPSQNVKAGLPKYGYPDEVLSVSDMQTICNGGVDFSVGRCEAEIIGNLDNHPQRRGLFGNHFLLSSAKAAAKAAARAKARAKATKVIPIELSAREMKIVEGLGVEC